MTAWTNIDHFEGEDVIITIEKEGLDTATNIEGKVSSLEISGGTQSTEDVFLFGSKTINFQKPREKFNVKMDFITSNPTFTSIWAGGTTNVDVAGTEIRVTDANKRCRIILWFQPSANHAANAGRTIVVPKKNDSCRRMIFCDCKAVEVTTSMAADDMLKGTISFEFSATDSNGYANYFDEYVNTTTSVLTTLVATAHKGTLSWNYTTPAWSSSYRT